MNKYKNITILLIMILLTLPMSTNAQNITAQVDNSSTYVPTNIINGDFSTMPWMKFTYNGQEYTNPSMRNMNINSIPSNIVINKTNQGWNTTEEKLLDGSLFEWIDGFGNGIDGDHGWKYVDDTPNYLVENNFFIEMNANNPALLYQDLSTKPGDIIEWSLDHAVRTTGGDDIQAIRVEIGSPKYNGNEIIYPTGVGANINSNINESTSAKYENTGVINGTLNLGYANTDDLANLSLNRNEYEQWYSSKGVYIVPNDENVTRFAFISTSVSDPGCGNMLDNIRFSTLIGNLEAELDLDGSVVITGYWGDLNTNNKLAIKLGEDLYKIDMSSVCEKNFKIVIPQENIDPTIQKVIVYHEDYEVVSKTVNISRDKYEKYQFELKQKKELQLKQGETKELEIGIDAPIEILNSLKIDNTILEKDADYQLEEEKIIFLESGINKINKLKNGKHTLNIGFTNNKTITQIIQIGDITNPKTADNINLYIMIGIISLMGLLLISIYILKNKTN